MDYGQNVVSCLERLRLLAIQQDPVKWETIDHSINNGIHNLRLYCAFSDEPRPKVNDWKLYVLGRMNTFICLRNMLLADIRPRNNEHGENGPLGIILYLTNIPECIKCYNDEGKQKTPSTLEILSQCVTCNKLCDTVVLSKLCDIHAPWRCKKCGSFDMIAVQVQDEKQLRRSLSMKWRLLRPSM